MLIKTRFGKDINSNKNSIIGLCKRKGFSDVREIIKHSSHKGSDYLHKHFKEKLRKILNRNQKLTKGVESRVSDFQRSL